jgi:hypothetical protein
LIWKVFVFLIIGIKDRWVEDIGVVKRWKITFVHFVSEGLAELVMCAFTKGAALLSHGRWVNNSIWGIAKILMNV